MTVSWGGLVPLISWAGFNISRGVGVDPLSQGVGPKHWQAQNGPFLAWHKAVGKTLFPKSTQNVTLGTFWVNICQNCQKFLVQKARGKHLTTPLVGLNFLGRWGGLPPPPVVKEAGGGPTPT